MKMKWMERLRSLFTSRPGRAAAKARIRLRVRPARVYRKNEDKWYTVESDGTLSPEGKG